jgi:hypothetical protein
MWGLMIQREERKERERKRPNDSSALAFTLSSNFEGKPNC